MRAVQRNFLAIVAILLLAIAATAAVVYLGHDERVQRAVRDTELSAENALDVRIEAMVFDQARLLAGLLAEPLAREDRLAVSRLVADARRADSIVDVAVYDYMGRIVGSGSIADDALAGLDAFTVSLRREPRSWRDDGLLFVEVPILEDDRGERLAGGLLLTVREGALAVPAPRSGLPGLPGVVLLAGLGAIVAFLAARRLAAPLVAFRGSLLRDAPTPPVSVHELEEARHVVRDLREELSRAETQAQGLRTMLESMRSGVLATDAAGRIVLGNEAAATLLGLSADRLTDAVLTDFLGLDENQLGAMWQELRISGSLDNLEIELHAKDMARSPMLVWGSRLPEPTAEGGVYVFVFHDISERKSLEEKLIHKTLHDELTGLPNKVHLLRRLSEELGQLAEEPGGSLALVFIDLDRFKHVNEVFGHGVGDQLLTYIARRLSSLVRSGDMIARVGSDEFVILLGNLRRSETALEIGRRAQATIARPVDVEGRELLVRGVVGIVQTDDAEADPARLLTDADIAMYRAKAAGGDRLAVFTEEMRADFERLTAVESSLREAVLVKRFEVRYQPIVDIQSRRCAGLEAFVRWRHPERGLLPPAEFITLACETGLIMPLGRIMREQAFADFRELKRSHPVIEFLSVNIAAPELFRREGFVEDFMAAVGLGGLSPSEVAVEVTETSILENPAESGRLLRELKEYGIRLVLDDFGVGVSSLSHLSDFPFDMVKIDRGAVAAMLHDEAAMAMVRSVCDLGRTMQVDILAEGVETEEQRRTLAGLGCPRFQGYLQSAPATIGEIDEMLDAAPDAGANS